MTIYRKLQDYPFVRLRTEIYLGSREPVTQTLAYFDGQRLGVKEFTYVPALLTYFREMLDNALDEVVGRKRGKNIWIAYDSESMTFAVEDDGHGIPIDHDKTLGGIPASILLSEVQASSNFDEKELAKLGLSDGKGETRGKWAGINGVGGSVVNFTSEWFDLDVWRNHKHFSQKWTEGTNKIKTKGHKITQIEATKHGTRVCFKPSDKVFRQMLLPEELVLSHLWMVAASSEKLTIYYNGEKLKPKKSVDTFKSTILHDLNVVPFHLENDEFSANYYLIWSDTTETENIYSMVNSVPTFNGGTHIDTFRNVFYTAVLNELAARAKREKVVLRRDDITTGLLLMNITHMNAPEFDAQNKARLQSPSASAHIKSIFTEDAVHNLLKANKAWVDSIIERAKKRNSAKTDSDLDKAQKSLRGERVAKLKDAENRVRSQCILFLGEGDSAIDSGFLSARDRNIHGGLPLRGKVENVWKKDAKDILLKKKKKKDEDDKIESPFLDIMKSIGLRFGTKCDRTALRYAKCFIATDSDQDGKHITNLLILFFYKFWPELFNPVNPFLYKFHTPLIIARKNKQVRYFYEDEYHIFGENIADFKGWEITRAKGLGALKKADWEFSLKNNRIDPVVDDGKLLETLELLFAGDTEARKRWLAND